MVAVRQKNIKLNRETLDRFKRVMGTADLVKFAKSKPLDFEIENDKKIIDTFLMSLDKAIPRTEEEEENQFAEELKRKKEKKQKFQRLAIPLGVVGFLVAFLVTFLVVSKGMDYARRITSYNVCYTKLLRAAPFSAPPAIRSAGIRWCWPLCP